MSNAKTESQNLFEQGAHMIGGAFETVAETLEGAAESIIDTGFNFVFNLAFGSSDKTVNSISPSKSKSPQPAGA